MYKVAVGGATQLPMFKSTRQGCNILLHSYITALDITAHMSIKSVDTNLVARLIEVRRLARRLRLSLARIGETVRGLLQSAGILLHSVCIIQFRACSVCLCVHWNSFFRRTYLLFSHIGVLYTCGVVVATPKRIMRLTRFYNNYEHFDIFQTND